MGTLLTHLRRSAAATALFLALSTLACGGGSTSSGDTSNTGGGGGEAGSGGAAGNGGTGGTGGTGGMVMGCDGAPDGAPCGDSASSECDAPDTCQGGQCVKNNKAAGDPCGDSASSECDAPDTCDGAGQCATNPVAAGTACGDPAATQCTAPDSCDGMGTCQPNHADPGNGCGDSSTTECSDPDSCDGSGNCLTNDLAVGAACGDGMTTECSAPDSCDGAGTCAVNDVAAGMACGDGSMTECSAPDSCDGAGTCAANDVAAGAACGDASMTECTAPDSCDGAGSCLANHATAGAACGDASMTECSAPDSCDGAGSCLANNLSAGAACGDASMTPCTAPDTCNGAGVCSPNHQPAGTACGNMSNTDCDKADTCNAAGACVTNVVADGTACNDCSGGPGQCGTCLAGGCPDANTCLNGYTYTSLLTTLAGGNSQNGNMFDITAIGTVVIRGFDVHPQSATTYEVYTKTGTYVGSEANAAAWTKIATYPNIMPNANGSPLPRDLNVQINAGQTQAFYVTASTGGVVQNYTNGTTEGNVFAQDGTIQIKEGKGIAYPFAGSFSPRIFNGRVHYTPGPLATTGYTGGAAHAGNMFDVQAVQDVEITSLAVNLAAGAHDVELYYRPGTHVGFENNAGAWTLVAAANGVTSAGPNTPTVLPLSVGVIMNGGATFSFYVTTKGTAMNSTVGTMVGAAAFSGPSLIIREGVGKSYPFGTTTAPRRWNGTLFFQNCAP